MLTDKTGMLDDNIEYCIVTDEGPTLNLKVGRVNLNLKRHI